MAMGRKDKSPWPCHYLAYHRPSSFLPMAITTTTFLLPPRLTTPYPTTHLLDNAAGGVTSTAGAAVLRSIPAMKERATVTARATEAETTVTTGVRATVTARATEAETTAT